MGPHRSGELSLTDGASVFMGTRIWPCRPLDRPVGLVLDGILGVGHVAEDRHVDWIPMETMSSAFAIVLATRSARTQVQSSIWCAVHCRLTEGDSTNSATCVSCRKARLPRGLPRGL